MLKPPQSLLYLPDRVFKTLLVCLGETPLLYTIDEIGIRFFTRRPFPSFLPIFCMLKHIEN
jgi:hypothetical protein